MTHTDAGRALGAGLISAVLLFSGPCAAVATADPGHSGHSGRGHDGGSRSGGGHGRDGGGNNRDGHGQDGRGRDGGSRAHDRRGDDGQRSGPRDVDRGNDGRGINGRRGPQSGDGRDGRSGLPWNDPDAGDSDGSGSSDSGSDGSGSDGSSTGDSGSNDSGSSDSGSDVSGATAPQLRTAARVAAVPAATNEDSAGVQSTPASAAAPAPAAASGGGGGGVGADAAATPFTAPKVVFGNGREPGLLSRRSVAPQAAPNDQSPAPAPSIRESVAAPVAPVPAGASSGPAPQPVSPPLVPIPPDRNVVDRIWAPLPTSYGSGAWFGLAGLLIMPLLGVWLGQRQARAAKAADGLVDT